MEETRENNVSNEALHNDVILETLFKFLGAKDLQSCRLVCSKWEQISRSYFAKRSKVFIASDKYSEVLDNFKETFSDASVMPFTKFCFKGYFPRNKFDDFFNFWPTIKELFLECISLQDNNGKETKQYALNNSIFLNLKTLSFNYSISGFGRIFKTTVIVIPFSQISSIKNLYLRGPCILLCDHRICPEELSIQGEINFARDLGENGIVDVPSHLNDFIDLKHARRMGINKLVEPFYTHELTVDVTDCQRLENLSHHWGTLVGLSQQSKIRELRISTPCDLSLLPVNLERLELANDSVSCTGGVNLPNLKHLYLPSGIFLTKFLNCPNLTDLMIGGICYDYPNGPIPLRVSKMFLSIWPFFRPSNIAQLNYLHLELHDGTFLMDPLWAVDFFVFVQSQTLVISFKSEDMQPLFTKHRGTTFKTSDKTIIHLMRIIDLQSARGGIVALGGIEWDADCNSFFARVDRKSEFYLFTNREGKGIDKAEFEKLIQLKCSSTFLTMDAKGPFY